MNTSADRPPELVEPPPIHRRRLLVLREADFDEATYKAPELFTDAETWTVNYDQVVAAAEATPVLAQLIRSRALRPGQIFLLSPFDDDYAAAGEAEESFSLRKFEIFTNLCRLLGAREVAITQDGVKQLTHHQKADLGAEKGPVSGGITASRDVRRRLKQRLEMTTRFDPVSPNVESAENLLRMHGLIGDSTMRGLLNFFRDGENRVISQNLVLNVTSEASRELKAVASLKTLVFPSIAAQISDLNTDVEDLLVEYRVSF